MDAFRAKFRLIFIPYLTIVIGTIATYLLFIYLFTIRQEVLFINEKYREFFIPAALPWIPIIIWLRPRIKYLKLKTVGRRDPVFNFMLLAWIITGFTASFSEGYLETVTGEVTYIDIVDKINLLHPTKYYKIKRKVFINKRLVAPYSTMNVSGKHSENLKLTIFVPMPISDSNEADTTAKGTHVTYSDRALLILDGKVITKEQLHKLNPDSIEDINVLKPPASVALYGKSAKYGVVAITTKKNYTPRNYYTPRKKDSIPVYAGQPSMVNVGLKANVWLGIKYSQNTGNTKSETRNQALYHAFAEKSQVKFNRTIFNDFIYLERIGINDDRKDYMAAINNKYNIGNPTILLPVYTPFEMRNGNNLQWAAAIFAGGSALFLFILRFFSLRPQHLKDPEQLY